MASRDRSQEETVPPLQRLWRIVIAEREDIGLVIVYGVAVGVFSLVVPIAAQSLVNTVAFNSLLQPIVVLTVVVLLMLGVASILRVIQTTIVEKIQQRIFARISLDLAYRLPRVKIEAFDRSRSTELVNRFFEVLTVQKSAALMLLDGLAIVLQAAIGLVLLAFYHPLLLVFDILLVLSIAVVLWVPARHAVGTSVAESKAKYRVAAWLEEIARNPLAFRLSGGARHALDRANEVTLEYLSARKAHFRVLVRQIGGTLLVQTAVSGLLLGLGSFLVIKKQLTLGQLVAAEIVVTMVVSGFAKFGKHLESFYDLVASVDKLGNLFDLPLEREHGERSREGSGPYGVSVRNLSFRYSSGVTSALSQADLDIEPGTKLGINGANGSGKSTLLDLLVGLRHPSSGAVEINGVDLREVRLEEIRERIALVRDIEIFDGTVLENIRVGRRDITIEDARNALAEVGLLEEISQLPDGLLTEMSGSQSPLSAGQSQRLMLARAIVGKPGLLLLDESLENLDPESKEIILRTLFRKDAPWTLVLTTHDSYELSFCDRVIRVDEGKLYTDRSTEVRP